MCNTVCAVFTKSQLRIYKSKDYHPQDYFNNLKYSAVIWNTQQYWVILSVALFFFLFLSKNDKIKGENKQTKNPNKKKKHKKPEGIKTWESRYLEIQKAILRKRESNSSKERQRAEALLDSKPSLWSGLLRSIYLLS